MLKAVFYCKICRPIPAELHTWPHSRAGLPPTSCGGSAAPRPRRRPCQRGCTRSLSTWNPRCSGFQVLSNWVTGRSVTQDRGFQLSFCLMSIIWNGCRLPAPWVDGAGLGVRSTEEGACWLLQFAFPTLNVRETHFKQFSRVAVSALVLRGLARTVPHSGGARAADRPASGRRGSALPAATPRPLSAPPGWGAAAVCWLFPDALEPTFHSGGQYRTH